MKNFCGNCGQKIDKKTGLCPKCDKTTLDAMKKKQKRMMGIIIAVCVVVVGIAIAWFAMKKTDDASSDGDAANQKVDEMIPGEESSATENENSGEESSEEKNEISDDMIQELKNSLVKQYGLSFQEMFVSCLGPETKSYPSEINGIISMTDVDIDEDGMNEILVIRVKCAENIADATIIVDIYQYKDGDFLLTTSEAIYGVLFCSGADIYMFYSDVLKQYCLMVDSASTGSYTGVDSYCATIYTVANDEIKQYKSMEAVPFMDIEVDFETEFDKIGVPHAKYCTEYNRLSDNDYYQQLCEVEHEMFGDSSGYETRNHRLKIVDPGSNQSSESEDSENIWKVIPDAFIFSSGAGAWSTDIEIDDDGTFRGVYHDSNMGEMEEGYPNGTVYVCEFEGKFTTPKKVSDTIYSMKLEKITVKDTPGKVYIEDGFKYICSDPYGFDDANEFLIYMPGTPISDVEEEFLSWSFLAINSIQEIPEGFYGIYNIGGEQGFIADERYN